MDNKKKNTNQQEELPNLGLHEPRTILAGGTAFATLAILKFVKIVSWPVELAITAVIFAVVFWAKTKKN